MIEKLYIFY